MLGEKAPDRRLDGAVGVRDKIAGGLRLDRAVGETVEEAQRLRPGFAKDGGQRIKHGESLVRTEGWTEATPWSDPEQHRPLIQPAGFKRVELLRRRLGHQEIEERINDLRPPPRERFHDRLAAEGAR